MKFNKKSIVILTTIVTMMLIITITTIYNSETRKQESFSIEEERTILESPNEIVIEFYLAGIYWININKHGKNDIIKYLIR